MKSPSSVLPLMSAACLAALLALTGCGANKPGWASLNPNDWSNQRRADDPLVLELEGPISLDIDTFAGDVVIEADPARTTGEVTIIREARFGHGRSKEGKASLADISASVDIVPADTSRGELGQTLRIRTSTSNPERFLQRAHVHVKAPAIDGVFVHAADGSVTVRHIEGAVDIETSNGLASVRTNLAMNKPVTIINKNGDIIFRASGESAGALDAQTVGGVTSADLRLGSVTVDAATRDDSFRATLNAGKDRWIFRTTNGDIKIAVMAENEQTIIMPSNRKPPKEEPLVEPAASQPESE